MKIEKSYKNKQRETSMIVQPVATPKKKAQESTQAKNKEVLM